MKKKILTSIAAVALIGCLGACTQDQKTLGGAAVGGVTGLAVGNAVGGTGATILGGLGGTAIGAAIGHNMD